MKNLQFDQPRFTFLLAFILLCFCDYETITAQNFGIGIATPQEKLDLNGAIRIGAASNANDGTLRYTSANGFEGRHSGSWVNFSATSGASLWTQSGSDIFRNSGQVGVGTSAPASALEVRNMVSGQDAFRVYNSGKLAIKVGQSNSTTDFYATYSASSGSSAEAVRIMSEAGTEAMRLRVGGNGGVGILEFVDPTSTANPTPVKLDGDGDSYFNPIIGNFGIGTNSPSATPILSSLAAIFTPSPLMSPSSNMVSLQCMPIRTFSSLSS